MRFQFVRISCKIRNRQAFAPFAKFRCRVQKKSCKRLFVVAQTIFQTSKISRKIFTNRLFKLNNHVNFRRLSSANETENLCSPQKNKTLLRTCRKRFSKEFYFFEIYGGGFTLIFAAVCLFVRDDARAGGFGFFLFDSNNDGRK